VTRPEQTFGREHQNEHLLAASTVTVPKVSVLCSRSYIPPMPWAHPWRSARLAETGDALIGGVAQHRPPRRAFPASTCLTDGNAFGVELAGDLSDAEPTTQIAVAVDATLKHETAKTYQEQLSKEHERLRPATSRLCYAGDTVSLHRWKVAICLPE